MEGALRLMDVPPDDIDTWLAAQAAAEARLNGKHVAAAAAPTRAAVAGVGGPPDDAAVAAAGAVQ
jgi:cell division protein FtsI (penicillin-binding protein 3)